MIEWTAAGANHTVTVNDVSRHVPQLLHALLIGQETAQFIAVTLAQHLREHPGIDDPWLPIWHTAAGVAQGLTDLMEQLREVAHG